jgi:hypothetical protein
MSVRFEEGKVRTTTITWIVRETIKYDCTNFVPFTVSILNYMIYEFRTILTNAATMKILVSGLKKLIFKYITNKEHILCIYNQIRESPTYERVAFQISVRNSFVPCSKPMFVAWTTVRRSGSVHVGRLFVSADFRRSDVRKSGTPCTRFI